MQDRADERAILMSRYGNVVSIDALMILLVAAGAIDL
jgi:hypothetical protein